jgi:CP family cyanate transporter-like MFS transporter
LLLGLVVALVAFNLRPAVASVGPVLPEVRTDLSLSGVGASFLTFLPVLCFGLLAVAAPRLARRSGIEPVLLGMLVVVAVGLAGRVVDGSGLLYLGTALAGGAIAVGNVLVPPLIKRDFPDRTGLMMGVYTMAVSGSAAVAAGLTVPAGDAIGFGWRGALGVWAVPAVLAAAAWLPQVRAHTRPAEPPPGPSLVRSGLAWQVTVYFGLQSLSFYAVLAWLPSIYREYGMSPAAAGLLLSVAGLVQIPVALVLPPLATRAANQVGYIARARRRSARPDQRALPVGGVDRSRAGSVFRARAEPVRAAHPARARDGPAVGHGAEHRLRHLRVRPVAGRAAA